MPYPGIVELGLNADVVTFFLVLRPENLELGRFQRAGAKRQASQVAKFRGSFRRLCHGPTDLSASAASVTMAPTSQFKESKRRGNPGGDLHGRFDMVLVVEEEIENGEE